MLKKILKLIIIIGFCAGVYFGFNITGEKRAPEIEKKEIEKKIFGNFQTRSAQITGFYTYGRSLNIDGKIANIDEDNFESIRLVISDGKNYQKMYRMDAEFKDEELYFSSDQEINHTIIIDELKNGEYYLFLRIKLNNSVDPRYYSFEKISECEDIEYYTLTKEEVNRKAEVCFKKKTKYGKK